MTTIPVADSRTPEERWHEAIRAGERNWRPNTRRYRLEGAMAEAEGFKLEQLVFWCAVWADEKPARLDIIARQSSLSVEKTRRMLLHLEKHGWISRVPGGVTVHSGSDCDCPGAKRRDEPATPPRPDVKPGFTALYRLYDAEGILLYVGITDDLRARMDQHSREKPWWPEVARRTVAWYSERDDADRAETVAIAAEKPTHNKAKLYVPSPAVEF